MTDCNSGGGIVKQSVINHSTLRQVTSEMDGWLQVYYICIHITQVNSTFHSSGVDKRVLAHLAAVKVEQVHLCQVIP